MILRDVSEHAGLKFVQNMLNGYKLSTAEPAMSEVNDDSDKFQDERRFRMLYPTLLSPWPRGPGERCGKTIANTRPRCCSEIYSPGQ